MDEQSTPSQQQIGLEKVERALVTDDIYNDESGQLGKSPAAGAEG